MRHLNKLLLGILAATALSSCERIDAGYEGVKVNLYGSEKGVDNVSLVTGMVWYNPITTRVIEYPAFVQTIDYQKFSINAKDGSEFLVDPTVSLKIRKGSAPFIYSKYRKDLNVVVETTLFNYVKDAFRVSLSNYTTDEIVSSRELIEKSIESYLKRNLEKENFILEQLTTGLKYPETIVNAVNAKNKAIQDAIKAENELKIAEAEARKLLVRAKAEKEANEIKSKALTPEILKQMAIEKWDGTLPKVVTDKTALMLNMK